MKEYRQDIFYNNSREFTPEVWEKICRDAHSKCYKWWVDDQPSWTRRKIDMSIDEVIKFLYNHKIHFSIIHRRGYDNRDWHLEIGFCTLARKDKNGDIFLWIELDEKYLPYFIETYKLKEK